jgi:hypothetical protein
MAISVISPPQIQECIVECDSCHDLCIETITHCLTVGGRHADPAHVTLLMDCAQICQTASDFMLRGSTLNRSACRVCTEVCEACAVSCAHLDGDEMKACTEACRRCAQACRRMAAGA